MTDIAGKGFLQVYTHNLKVVGSNPTPATNDFNDLAVPAGGGFSRLVAKKVATIPFSFLVVKNLTVIFCVPPKLIFNSRRKYAQNLKVPPNI